jgi:hypothetical protein
MFTKNIDLNTYYIQVNDTKVKCLIDTGSDVNLLDSQILNGKWVLECCKSRILAANKKSIDVLGLVKNVKIIVGGRVLNTDFVIARDLPHKCILGYELLYRNAKFISFDANKIKLELFNNVSESKHFNKLQVNKEKKLFCDDIRDVGTCN